MSEYVTIMESIEKAREAIRKDHYTNANLAEAFDAGKDAFPAQTLEVVFDAIESELAERFMERPVDADGAPIRMGDAVEGELLDGTTVRGTVCAFHLYDDEPDSVFVHVDVDADGGWTIKDLRLTRCRHVNPRTVEDVLRDCCTEWNEHLGSDWETGVYAKYAAEIRELMANDGLAPENGVSAHGWRSNDGEVAL